MKHRIIAAALAAALPLTLAPAAGAQDVGALVVRGNAAVRDVQNQAIQAKSRFDSLISTSSSFAGLSSSLFGPAPAPGKVVPGQPRQTDRTTAETAQNSRTPLFSRINQYRAENGRAKWSRNAHLDAQAQRWAEQLVREQKFYHQPGANVWENIAFSPNDPMAAFEQWRKSPAHNRNMLERQSGSAGIGIAYGYLPEYGWGYISVMQATW